MAYRTRLTTSNYGPNCWLWGYLGLFWVGVVEPILGGSSISLFQLSVSNLYIFVNTINLYFVVCIFCYFINLCNFFISANTYFRRTALEGKGLAPFGRPWSACVWSTPTFGLMGLIFIAKPSTVFKKNCTFPLSFEMSSVVHVSRVRYGYDSVKWKVGITKFPSNQLNSFHVTGKFISCWKFEFIEYISVPNLGNSVEILILKDFWSNESSRNH